MFSSKQFHIDSNFEQAVLSSAKWANNLQKYNTFPSPFNQPQNAFTLEPLYQRLSLDFKLFNGDYFSESYRAGNLDLTMEDLFKLIHNKEMYPLSKWDEDQTSLTLRTRTGNNLNMRAAPSRNQMNALPEMIATPLEDTFAWVIQNNKISNKINDNQKLRMVLKRVASSQEMCNNDETCTSDGLGAEKVKVEDQISYCDDSQNHLLMRNSFYQSPTSSFWKIKPKEVVGEKISYDPVKKEP